MATFWDSSALVSLVLEEPGSSSAGRAWCSSNHRIAWSWLWVESHSALVRRNATKEQFSRWRDFAAAFAWVDLPVEDYSDLINRNGDWRLRSADAGHLYLFRQLLPRISELVLVTFDREMWQAGQKKKWPLWDG